ncbi:hypothetical protein CSOJ01_04271 [Colletotrichum sojae]|uniref:Uncharacterized protein n=1 Tax=Colletotrichum sojae TaxID=2175907 RepID=A0A8H6MZI5_9PEZI|nr:hypothetical protein CSOJ01_04271 [Colletotrichum sojae]
MHIPTFGQVATIGMAFFAVAAMAVPIAEPVEADLAERSTEINTRAEGLAIAGADIVARSGELEQRNRKKKCKRTNKKGNCTDSDSDSDYEKKKKCKRNKKGKCDDSDSDSDHGKNKNCKRNKKGKCDDDKKNDNKYDDKKNDNKWDDKKDDKKNDNKYDDKKNGGNKGHY